MADREENLSVSFDDENEKEGGEETSPEEGIKISHDRDAGWIY